ncbi:wall-associated receptor kinase-like 16 [Canna indica]|uniref:Wall-associated receptor kinase-like 16 n=1 Tax=Canna indica TaxID=4628 RepID=A0AAQ3JW61_9LILI|nr:wall-associated receptor kinase-like 16 [Canna indica]
MRRSPDPIQQTLAEAMVSSSLPLLLLLLLTPGVASAAPADGCPTRCGDVDIPYPFGIGPECSFDAGFALTCNETLKKPFFYNIEVHNFSLADGQARMISDLSWQCYNSSDKTLRALQWSMNLINSPYRFSDVHNKFLVIGCNTLAYIKGSENTNGYTAYTSGCRSQCSDKADLNDDSCSGIGCCQTSVPKDYNYYEIQFEQNLSISGFPELNPCSFAGLVEANSFKFQKSFILTDELKDNGSAPFVLDWAIGNQTCEEAKLKKTSYACISENSVCVDSANGPGYLCNCSIGYQGNPYLREPHGCRDIDECVTNNPCSGGSACHNLPGTYNCLCPPGEHHDDYSNRCMPKEELPLAAKVAIGASSSLAFVLLCSMCICLLYERRKLIKARKRYFREHGGRLLLEEIRGREGHALFKIFTSEELEKATNKYDKNRILGQGGYGTVYKGILEDSRVVAIKKPKSIDDSQNKEFGKEMIILSQINHKNIVKLLGCCLEVQVPMLVYEFVPNRTLYHLIHENNNTSLVPLDTRLRIAYESADALAYLHSSASPPIIHGDVKTSNILLGEDYTAKVSDFGASKLVPKDEDQFATLVQGTCGYLDPEYLLTCQLTEKSDVYSFGVVLLELLTSKKAVYFEGAQEERSLASSFILAMKENRLLEVLDVQVKNEGDAELIQEISQLAKQCLSISGEERPTMKQVADELDQLRKYKQHPWIPSNPEEIENLLGEPLDDHGMYTSTSISSTAGKRMALDIESGR